ncbi:conserved hypothetical protein, partial [Ricinus communis]
MIRRSGDGSGNPTATPARGYRITRGYNSRPFAATDIMTAHFAPLVLNPNAERRLRAGHVWIYSNEIDTKKSPLKSFEAGQQVHVVQSNGKPL